MAHFLMVVRDARVNGQTTGGQLNRTKAVGARCKDGVGAA